MSSEHGPVAQWALKQATPTSIDVIHWPDADDDASRYRLAVVSTEEEGWRLIEGVERQSARLAEDPAEGGAVTCPCGAPAVEGRRACARHIAVGAEIRSRREFRQALEDDA